MPDMTKWSDEQLERVMATALTSNRSQEYIRALNEEAKRRGWSISVTLGL